MIISQDILKLEKALLKLENLHASFDYLRITVASPKRIKLWGERRLPNGYPIGEVTRGETINFRSQQPEVRGLFCEQIFGPMKNWRCKCGKYGGLLIEKICEECLVEVTEARVRRYRMGHIELARPVTHLWYLKGVPSYLSILLRCFHKSLTVSHIEQIVYFREGERVVSKTNPLYPFCFPARDPKPSAFRSLFSLDNVEKEKKNPFPPTSITGSKPKKRLGAEVIKVALESLDVPLQINTARELLLKLSGRNFGVFPLPEKGLIRRIRILESFFATKIDPAWLVLTVLPVLPPNLRPLVELENGRLVAADINEIYRIVITRNQRLFDFSYRYQAPDLVTVHSRKLLQEAVDALIDNSRLPKQKIFSLNNKALKSLTETLEGKQGRFRHSLLGKRVDYSGRSVIIVGPTLRLNQCGIPYEMAMELFQPFLINELLKSKLKAPGQNTKSANFILKKKKPFLWLLLESLLKKHCLLLNRAPTLHRFGIQAFDPVLVLGQAIHLHPLVCTGFNADFDGDQMAVHLPLYETSQLEAKTLMRPSQNVLSPSNGEVILKPSQDMVIGCYYLTLMIKKHWFPFKKVFSNEEEVFLAFSQKKIELHSAILVRYSSTDFQIKKENGTLFLINRNQDFQMNKKEIFIRKILPLSSFDDKKYMILTNLGIFLMKETNDLNLSFSDFFLETSPGRLIFSVNINNLLKKA